MDEPKNLFFELIQVSLGTRIGLSHTPSANEWSKLYDMAKKQSLVGVCFAGIQQLQKQEIPKMLYLTWMGMAAKILHRNEVINGQCIELQTKLSEAGIQSSILKGQGVALFYDERIRALRQSGDIDVYVDCGRQSAIRYAHTIQKIVDYDRKHLHLKMFQDTEVEMHYIPEILLNLRKNKKLQKWFFEHQIEMFIPSNQLICPSLKINLFYILLHIYRHFMYEGIGMKQLMDYYFVLRALSIDPFRDKYCNTIRQTLKDFGMLRFAAGVMWIMNSVFGLEHDLLLCNPNEKEGQYILTIVMTGGNFGHHIDKGGRRKGKCFTVMRVFRHNFHLLSHYPEDAIWPPIYFGWHKIWKLINK